MKRSHLMFYSEIFRVCVCAAPVQSVCDEWSWLTLLSPWWRELEAAVVYPSVWGILSSWCFWRRVVRSCVSTASSSPSPTSAGVCPPRHLYLVLKSQHITSHHITTQHNTTQHRITRYITLQHIPSHHDALCGLNIVQLKPWNARTQQQVVLHIDVQRFSCLPHPWIVLLLSTVEIFHLLDLSGQIHSLLSKHSITQTISSVLMWTCV